jgi:hypothetical protein
VIVVDVGCAGHGGDESIPDLLDLFRPDVLYGFDPALEEESDTIFDFGGRVVLSQEVAWTFYGRVGFVVAGLGGHVEPGAQRFDCIDLAEFILGLPDPAIVLKMDAEGAEYVLLPHLVAEGADLKLQQALIEWHCELCGIGGNGRHLEGCKVDRDWWLERREKVESAMRCEMGEWNR